MKIPPSSTASVHSALVKPAAASPVPRLELSMIVRNAAATLPRCLESVRGLVQRIVIGDTGSEDDTCAIARSYGAEVFSIPWRGDFSHARNAVLRHAALDWVLVLDADEMLDAGARERIPALIADPAVYAYQGWIWNYVQQLDYRCGGQQAMRNPVRIEQARAYPAYVCSLNTRLFRRHPEIYFEHCVHETVTHRLEAQGLLYKPADFLIHHFGYVEDAEHLRARKNKNYYEMALRKAAAAPSQYQARLEAGMGELDYARNPAAALLHLKRACTLEPRRATAWLYAGLCCTQLGAYEDASQRLRIAVELDPNNPLTWRSLGDVFFQTGKHRQACEAYQQARNLGAADVLLVAKLGAAEVKAGLKEQGLARIQQAVREHPEAAELYEILAGSAFLAGQYAVACAAADRRLSMAGVSGFHFVFAATLHHHAGREDRAHAVLRAGRFRFPEHEELENMKARLHERRQ